MASTKGTKYVRELARCANRRDHLLLSDLNVGGEI